MDATAAFFATILFVMAALGIALALWLQQALWLSMPMAAVLLLLLMNMGSNFGD